MEQQASEKWRDSVRKGAQDSNTGRVPEDREESAIWTG